MFCPRCIREVEVKKIMTPAFDGTVIVEYYCSLCGSLLEIKREKLALPERKIPVRKGVYIAFEGIDGSGKSHYLRLVSENLRKEGYEIVTVKEPWLKAIKDFLYKHEIDPDAEVYVFAADRIILQKEVILPALEEGKIVLSERSVYASIAYQGTLGVPEDFIRAINRSIKLPDKVLLLDLPAEEAFKRIKDRKILTKYQNIEFLENVRKKFLELAEKEKNRFIIIDAQRNTEEVEKDIKKEIKNILKEYLD
ncbi:MAG: dTMP kinase [Thermoprotei archaeon]|nr:MAG: dTMP kinase [Thermoprotei archaeon]